MIINEILTARSNPQAELDSILARCCEMVLAGQASDPDFYGLVGACVVFPNGNKVYGVSYHDDTTGKVVHAERAALDRCNAVDSDCIVITTLSPCNERHDKTAAERYGESCEDLIANSGIQRVYCGYKDFTQDHSDSTVTENTKLRELCKRLADTFLKKDITESQQIASAEQVWDYVDGIHPKDQQGGGFLKSLIMKYPQYELRRIPLSDIHIPDQEYDDEEQEDEHNDPYNRAMFVDPDHAGEYSQYHVDRNPIVIDANGYILDGNHRAWAAAELLNKTDIMAWVPAKKLTEGQSVKQEIEEFLDSLTPDDVGVEEFPGYRVHFEGFTDDCKSSGDYRRNPDAVYQQVYQDFVDREHGRTPIESNMVGDEEYPILYSIFRVKQGVAEGKVKLHTDPGYFGAEVDDTGFDSLPVVNIPTNQLVGFEPDSKMNQPKSRANVEKIVAGLKKGDKLPPLLVRKYKNGYQVLDGHHRFWAYKLSGTKSIPVRIVADKDIEEIGKQGVAEGLDTKENPDDQVRNKLNAWMEQDQQFTDPTRRASFQSKVWPYIQQNIKTILADKGEKGNGDYPAAPYAAWLLVQHMDAYPQNQIEFYNALKQAIPNHPKIQFLRDRAAVNRWILKLNDPKKYIDKHGKPLTNPTADVRDPSKFDDAGIEYTSAADALKGAISAGNTLLVDAVKKSRATTQPSYKQGVTENFADGKKPGRKGLAKRSGVNTKASISSLRKTAKNSSGEKQRMAHWLANMKAGKKK